MNRSHEMIRSEVPLHYQIYVHLRAEIQDGLWVGRDDFPGENELARRFGVSVVTARTALGRLSDEGWIERSRGRRTRILQQPKPSRRGPAPEILQTVPRRAFTYRVLDCGAEVAPVEACAAFGLAPGSTLWMCSRLRIFKGRPHSVTLNAQPVELGRQLPQSKLGKLPMAQILRESGIELAAIRRTVGATLAPLHAAPHLGLTLHDPTLVYTFTHHDDSERVVQWVRIWVHPDEAAPEEMFSYRTGTWTTNVAM